MSDSDKNDSDKVIELIKSRTDEGMKLLHEKYSGLMHYIVSGILENKNDVEECISDICMKVWNSIESYSVQKSKFSTWLTVIARNTALNYLRKNTGHEELNEENAVHSSPEDDVLRREQAEELKRAISFLSVDEQHIFYRKYYYLQQTAQIAAELGMTNRSVEGKLYRIRKKLQTKLGGIQ
ncbi:sigma-70 family RNA polymerase sigma factor [Sedimentibacter sp.]|uniref:RNA polymerase sigma factor n=1 Tax=Sedimentibacter sp. TaxID=1960295 RepID=UPI0028B1D827|nr:sigma-70 family RNA polymerase sigma factor [Sedimentibacter sp.]